MADAAGTAVLVDGFLAYTAGILVYFAGVRANRRFALLREFNIPEPVVGGLIAALFVFALYVAFGVEISFDLETRDRLLVYFFTCIGLGARLQDLLAGGRPLLVLLVVTLAFIVLQDLVGVSAAYLLGLPPEVGLLAGSAALIGGHGTAIAWAPQFEAAGVAGALELGVAAATLGLVLASLVGGPIARVLVERNDLRSGGDARLVGIGYEQEERVSLAHTDIMAVILSLHIAIICGWFLRELLAQLGLMLPLFVASLLSGILLANLAPRVLPALDVPPRSKSLALVSDFSLGLFLAMSLMSMQLWAIADLAGPLLVLLGAQTLLVLAYVFLVVFPFNGRDYQAAVLSAGFGGFALGATPTAIANMTAVTKQRGPAPQAFLILPLVAAFFVDVTNSVVLRSALSWLGAP